MVHVDLFLKGKTYLTRPKYDIATIMMFTLSYQILLFHSLLKKLNLKAGP